MRSAARVRRIGQPASELACVSATASQKSQQQGKSRELPLKWLARTSTTTEPFTVIQIDYAFVQGTHVSAGRDAARSGHQDRVVPF